jgi:hypothetical protein
MTVDKLNTQLRWLILERHLLRERGAGVDELERNRRLIVHAEFLLRSAPIIELSILRELERACSAPDLAA